MVRIFSVMVPTSVLALLVSDLVLLFTCYVTGVFFVGDLDPEVFLLYDNGGLRVAVVVASIMFSLYFLDMYNEIRVRSRIFLVQQISLALGITFLTQALLSYANPSFILPRWVMIGGSSLALMLLPAWRYLFAQVVVRALGSRRVLLLGDAPSLDELAEGLLDRPELGFLPIGLINDQSREVDPRVPYLGGLEQLRPQVESLRPEAIVVGMAERRNRLPMETLLDLRFSGVQVLEIASLYERCFGRVSTRELRPSQLIFTEELGPNPQSVSLQNIYGWVIAAFGVLLFAPLMLAVALAVKLTSPGPVLYRQRRVGYRDQVYTVFKFRTMRPDAERGTGAVWAQTNDPRVTPIGGFLRRTRLDELPQLFNVLRGEMSIAGPRPERPEFVHELAERIPFYRQRHCVKPGITGWAQISYRYGDSIEDVVKKLEYDLYYIKHLSFSLDLYIYFHTLKTMLLQRGAR
jgi:sugar transferase (PEP-CTERM system associated)